MKAYDVAAVIEADNDLDALCKAQDIGEQSGDGVWVTLSKFRVLLNWKGNLEKIECMCGTGKTLQEVFGMEE
jgi:hypothetical protein